MLPDSIPINGTNYSLGEWMFQPELGPKYGAKTIVEALTSTTGGEMAAGNHHQIVLPVIKNTLENGRMGCLKYQMLL